MQQNSATSLFEEIVEFAKNSNNFSEAILQAEAKYEIKAYRINSISLQQASNIYWYIKRKYSNRDYRLMDSDWHQNQRRIFVWFLIFYCKKFQTQPETMQNNQWARIALCFYDKNSMFLEYCGLNICKGKNRNNWTSQQDQKLVDIIQQQLVRIRNNSSKVGKWNDVAKNLFFISNKKFFKTPKQCRQRWLNHLDNSKNKNSWSLQQDKKLLEYIRNIGKKWAKIAKLLQKQRTQHMVKNRFHSLLRKYRNNRNQNQKQIMKILFQKYKIQDQKQIYDETSKKQLKQMRESQKKIVKKEDNWQPYQKNRQDSIQFIKKNGFIQYQIFSEELTPTKSDYDKQQKKEDGLNMPIPPKQMMQQLYTMMVTFNNFMRSYFQLRKN